MLIVCHTCDKNITGELLDKVEHKCKTEDIEQYIKQLNEELKELRNKTNDFRTLLNVLTKKYAEHMQSGLPFEICPEDILTLQKAVNGQGYNDVMRYLSEHLQDLEVICRANELFRSRTLYKRKTANEPERSFRTKLQDLYDALIKRRDGEVYSQAYISDVTPDDIMKDLGKHDN